MDERWSSPGHLETSTALVSGFEDGRVAHTDARSSSLKPRTEQVRFYKSEQDLVVGEIAAYLITFEKHEEWLTTSPKTRSALQRSQTPPVFDSSEAKNIKAFFHQNNDGRGIPMHAPTVLSKFNLLDLLCVMCLSSFPRGESVSGRN
ncbi:Calmodulin-binding transcription activator 1 [Triplophysa tibetana]|uniref:Calmodulin-binding transcription activator 1 n=1 Tax=Triplophysa tibetana TaxID=1572043 RepID=A0A5A9NDR2_9TELE|nr:Calmodulin-binding transcription activator 1 [Triplophysa tibetana]